MPDLSEEQIRRIIEDAPRRHREIMERMKGSSQIREMLRGGIPASDPDGYQVFTKTVPLVKIDE